MSSPYKFTKTPEQVLKFIIADLVHQLSNVKEKVKKLETQMLDDENSNKCDGCHEISYVHSRTFFCDACDNWFCSKSKNTARCEICDEDL